MAFSNVSRSAECAPLPVICSAVASALVLSIIFIVIGALGAQGTIPMAPVGAEIMLTLGVGFILGAVSGVAKALCR